MTVCSVFYLVINSRRGRILYLNTIVKLLLGFICFWRQTGEKYLIFTTVIRMSLDSTSVRYIVNQSIPHLTEIQIWKNKRCETAYILLGMSVAFLANEMSKRVRWRKRLSLSSSPFSGAVKKSPILRVSPTTSTLLNSGQFSGFILLDLSAWNCTLNSKFIYPTSYFNNSTWEPSRHLKLHMFNIKFLLISLSPLPPKSISCTVFLIC